MWARTGVGLARRRQGAGEVVEEVRKGVLDAVERAKARLWAVSRLSVACWLLHSMALAVLSDAMHLL